MSDIKWLDEIRERLEAATPGPWHKSSQAMLRLPYETASRYFIMAPDIRGGQSFMSVVDSCIEHDSGVLTEADAEFIANARMDVQRLVDFIEKSGNGPRKESKMDVETLKDILKMVGDIDEYYGAVRPVIQKVAEKLPLALIDLLKPVCESDDLRNLLVKAKAATLTAYIREGFTREEAIALMLSDAQRLANHLKQASQCRPSSSS